MTRAMAVDTVPIYFRLLIYFLMTILIRKNVLINKIDKPSSLSQKKKKNKKNVKGMFHEPYRPFQLSTE